MGDTSPLVCAHTTKTYSEVGWEYDYLLAICKVCEDKVEKGMIGRAVLERIKNQLKKTVSSRDRSTPVQLPYLISNNIYFGNNFVSSTDKIIVYRNLPLLWLETIDGQSFLNARFFDRNGTLISGIDKNVWAADRKRFYDFKIIKSPRGLTLLLLGRGEDTRIKLSIEPGKLIIHKSKFYVPGVCVEISEDGDLHIGTSTIRDCSFKGCGAAIGIG